MDAVRERSEVPDKWDEVIQSWDTASSISPTADYSVGMTFGIKDRTAYLLDVVRGRWSYLKLKARIVDYADQWEAGRVLVENTSSGLSLGQDLRAGGEPRRAARSPLGGPEPPLYRLAEQLSR